MPILQINIWICEICGAIASLAQHTPMWADFVVSNPSPDQMWGYADYDNIEKLACQSA